LTGEIVDGDGDRNGTKSALHVRNMYSCIEEEQKEIFVIHPAHTVAHPWAMVVHADDAAAADGAVVDTLLLHHVTFEAVAHLVEGFDFVQVYLAWFSVFPPLPFLLCFPPSIVLQIIQTFMVMQVLSLKHLLLAERKGTQGP
jgi:hypothetical protein